MKDSDPGDCTDALFDTSLIPQACTAPNCDAGTKKNLCSFDAAMRWGIERPRHRPEGCINHTQEGT